VSKSQIANHKSQIVAIDGSYGEGGGQVLRTALTLAALTGQAVRIERIRAGRKNPGLQPQHLTAVRAAAAVCVARLEGAELGSQALTFTPTATPRPGEYTFDVAEAAQGGSAGSVGLVLQTVLLPLVLADGESRLTLRGGTHVPWAPPVSYLEHVFLPALARMGVRAQVELVRWGFYPAGGGEIRVQIAGSAGPLRAIVLAERGDLRRVWGIAAVTNLPAHIPQRMADRAQRVLESEFGSRGGAVVGPESTPSPSVHIEPRRLSGSGPGAGIFLFAEYEHASAGFTAYGRAGLPSERVAEAACTELLAHHRAGAPADLHLADQLVLPAALAKGKSQVVTSQVTQHLLTNVWVVQQFMARELSIKGEEGTPGALVVREGAHD
jgi:RNA 3'-terminal phosphate cyclase (ATP)